jgi:hypothetical protein
VAEVLIEGYRLDVKEGLDFSFNYSIADVRDPNKRSTSYSKTIKCPSTKANDLLFGNIWDVNISNQYNSALSNINANFNPNKKAEARVVSDGVEVMTGVVQLRQITVENTKLEYEVVFIGKLLNFFSVLGQKKLRKSVDFSDLDHTYTSANVQATWPATLDYVYPMIDYGDDFNSNLGINNWTVREFRPALFAKVILDRIFAFAGFSYTSTLFNSTAFTDLIIPFGGEQIYADESVTSTRKFKASLSAPDGAYVSGNFTPINTEIGFRTLRLDNDSTGGNFDAGNNWSTSTFRYLVPNDGYYKFNISQQINLTRTTVNLARIYGGNVNIHLQIVKTDVALNTTIIGESVQPFSLVGNPASFDQTLDIGADCEEQLLLAGDKVQFRFLVNFNEFTAVNLLGQNISKDNLYTDFDLTTESSTGSADPSNLIFEGDNMPMNSVVPDVTMVDIIMAFIRMFNLYVIPDPLDENNLIIQTRDEYYASGIIRDWEHKIARDKAVTLKPMGLLSAKVYNYTYKQDVDYYNQRYEASHDRIYGDRRWEVDNDFLNETMDVEIIFSPTPIQIEGNTNRFVSRIYDEDISEGAKPTATNIRILYYDYLPCSIWSLTSEATGGTTVALGDYPYAGHLNNPLTPTLDLNFGIPLELFYQANAATGTLQYTNANLFNVYHRKHVEELTDKDSKLMTAEFFLTPWDIAKLDFRDQILVDNCYWRMNKVMDYNPFKPELTKVELFKVLDVVQTDVEVFTLGGIGGAGTDEVKPIVSRKARQLSQFNSYNGQVKGKRNIVDPNAMSFKILGDDNFIGDSSRNVSIVGDNNYVSSGLENVVIVNSDNQQVYQSNVTIVNGNSVTWRYVDATAAYDASDREFVLADATAGAFTVTLPAVADSTDVWINVKKVDSSVNAVTVSSKATGLIDGAATKVLSTQYDSVDFYCDGSNWFIRSSH